MPIKSTSGGAQKIKKFAILIHLCLTYSFYFLKPSDGKQSLLYQDKKSASALLSHEGYWKTDEEARPKQVRPCVGIYMEYFSVLSPQEA